MSATGSSAASRPRFLALDIFRGLTVLTMILVNTAGPGADAYAPLVHAAWTGFTPADLVFPSFLFAVGNAMSFALPRHLPAAAFLTRIARRAGLIFLLGFLLSWYPFVGIRPDGGWAVKALADTRIPGVLQRIALCYAVAAVAARWLDGRAVAMLAIVLLLAYWLILVGCSAPGLAYDMSGNAGMRLDLWLMGQGHLYRWDHGFDPEGVLGTLPATVNVLGGYLAGMFIRRRGASLRTVLSLTATGCALAVLGLAWGELMPISKKLWTGSFVLLTIGIALAMLAVLVELVERRGWRRGAWIFTIPGRNPLAIYLFSELLILTLGLIAAASGIDIYGWIGIAVFQRLTPGPFGSLLCAAFYTTVCWLFAWRLDRRGLYLKV